ncbi:MAG: putative thiosulfate sulfurtransferase [Acidimicrobiaceae bacterium]|nr:putative thiosulfate sulfurtransferase [Acidimicrobiaceae bacterium]
MIGPIVDLASLRELGDDVVVADVRWYLDGRSGRVAYDAGHIPGAVFVPLEQWLSAPATPGTGRHPLPAPEWFASGMSQLGIGDDATVIAYDDAGGVIAARLVWMLRVTGHEAALLDGGLSAWDGPLELGAVPHGAADFGIRPWPEDRLASIDEAADRSFVVLDARNGNRYRGEPDPVDPSSGHIPGARSLPCREHLDEGGKFLPADELRRRFAGVGVLDGAKVISYCGSGVTACHNLLALEHAGLGRGRLFPGSWSQWCNDYTRPVATGQAPG